MIGVATAEKISLYPLIEAWADDERGVQQRRVRRLARLLKEGMPLADAVEQIPGILRDADILAIRFGAQSGTLATTVQALLDETEGPGANSFHIVRKAIIYAGTVMLIGMGIVLFVRIKLLPAFVKIHQDFGTEPPWALRLSMQLTDVFAVYWWLVSLLALLLVWSAFSAGPGRFVRRTILGRIFRSAGELRAADVLQKLSIATGAGRPISGALSTLARYHFDPVIRHKLLFVRNEVEQGADTWHSMTAVGLLTAPEGRVLDSADRIGNRPWALKQLAFGKRRRTMRRLERLSDLLLPAFAILMGAFVLLQSLTLFLSITELVTNIL